MGTAQPLTFGELLKRARVAAGLTQAALAERAGLSVRGISDLERGINLAPRRDTVSLLAAALGLAGAEQERLLAAISRRHAPAITPPTLPTAPGRRVPRLVGRKRELDAIGAHLAPDLGPDVEPRPPLLLLASEPGIGKTRLLNEAATRAAAAGWTVLHGGCHRRSGQEPYTPLLGALHHYMRDQSATRMRRDLQGCGWLVRLLPELAESLVAPVPRWNLPAEQESRLMFAAVSRFLANVAGSAGTLLLLDDLQWAGADALALLATLVRDDHPERPLRVIGAYRTTEVLPDTPLGVLLADLARESLAVRLDLEPLAEDEAAELLTSLLADVPEDSTSLVPRLVERAGGVPFFLVSCAQAARSGGLATLEEENLPWNVSESLRQRIAMTGDAARTLLGVAAVVGRQASAAALLAMGPRVGRDEARTLEALGELCRARLLAERDNGNYLFPHDLIREVALADLGATRRRILHRQVAQALEQGAGPASAERLADHYLHSDTPDRAIPFLAQAAEQARQVYAHNEAASSYRVLVDRLDALKRIEEAARAREELGAVLRVMAAYDEALAVLERALATYRARGDHEGMGRTLAQLGWVYMGLGSPEEGIARLQPLLHDPEARRLPPRDLATVSLALVALCKVGGRYLAMLAAAERASAYAEAAGEPRLRARAAMERAISLMMLGSNREGFQALEEALPLVEESGDPTTLAQTLNARSVAHETRGAFDLAKHDLQRAVAAAERAGDPTLLAYMVNRRATNAFATGAWDQARKDYERAAELLRQIGQSWAHPYSLTGLGRLELARGNPEAGTAHLRRALDVANQTGDLQAILSIEAILAEPDLLAGRFAHVVERLAYLLEGRGQESDFLVLVLPLMWAYSALGQTERADTLLAHALARITADDNRLELINVRRAQAIVAARRRAWADAEAAALESLAVSHDMGLIHSEIKARHTLGELLRARGATERARVELEIAQAQCQRLGERLYGAPIERMLRELALRTARQRRTPVRAPKG